APSLNTDKNATKPNVSRLPVDIALSMFLLINFSHDSKLDFECNQAPTITIKITEHIPTIPSVNSRVDPKFSNISLNMNAKAILNIIPSKLPLIIHLDAFVCSVLRVTVNKAIIISNASTPFRKRIKAASQNVYPALEIVDLIS